MAKFKNLHTLTGKFSFKGIRYEFNGTFETQDKELATFLKQKDNWQLIEEEKPIAAPAPKSKAKENDGPKEDSKEDSKKATTVDAKTGNLKELSDDENF